MMRFLRHLSIILILISFATLLCVERGWAQEPSIRRALLIGISQYRHLPRLPGAKNDVEVVKHVLTSRYAFSPQHIRVLKDQDATRVGMLRALNQLVQESGPNDVVYFHYSGHGSQVQDLNGDEKDDHLDETVVPVDGRGEGIPDITDDELEEIFSKLKATSAVVVFDSCHSGTVTRGVAVQTRSVPADTRVNLYKNRSVRTRGVVPLISQRYILLTGAASHESALDGPVQGKFHGFFTYSLFKSLGSAPVTASAKDVFRGTERELLQIKTHLGRRNMPEPQLEAPTNLLNKPLFPVLRDAGNAASSPSASSRLTWLNVTSNGEGSVLLHNGAQMEAQPGSVWGIYPKGETAFVPGQEQGFAIVDQVEGANAIALVKTQGHQISSEGRAVLIAPRSPSGTPRVRFRDIPPVQQGQLLKALQQRLGKVEVVDAGEIASFVIDLTDGKFRVMSADGLEEVATFVASREVESADGVAALFRRAQHVSELLSLRNPTSQIEVGLQIVRPQQRGIKIVKAMEDPEYVIRQTGTPRSFSNSLQLQVDVNVDSYITIADIDAEGNLNILFPNSYQNADFHSQGFVKGGQEVLIPDSLSPKNRAGFHWDYAEPPGTDTLQVFASTDLETTQTIRQVLQRLSSRQSTTTRGMGSTMTPGLTLSPLQSALLQQRTRGVVTVPGEMLTILNTMKEESPEPATSTLNMPSQPEPQQLIPHQPANPLRISKPEIAPVPETAPAPEIVNPLPLVTKPIGDWNTVSVTVRINP